MFPFGWNIPDLCYILSNWRMTWNEKDVILLHRLKCHAVGRGIRITRLWQIVRVYELGFFRESHLYISVVLSTDDQLIFMVLRYWLFKKHNFTIISPFRAKRSPGRVIQGDKKNKASCVFRSNTMPQMCLAIEAKPSGRVPDHKQSIIWCCDHPWTN